MNLCTPARRVKSRPAKPAPDVLTDRQQPVPVEQARGMLRHFLYIAVGGRSPFEVRRSP